MATDNLQFLSPQPNESQMILIDKHIYELWKSGDMVFNQDSDVVQQKAPILTPTSDLLTSFYSNSEIVDQLIYDNEFSVDTNENATFQPTEPNLSTHDELLEETSSVSTNPSSQLNLVVTAQKPNDDDIQESSISLTQSENISTISEKTEKSSETVLPYMSRSGRIRKPPRCDCMSPNCAYTKFMKANVNVEVVAKYKPINKKKQITKTVKIETTVSDEPSLNPPRRKQPIKPMQKQVISEPLIVAKKTSVVEVASTTQPVVLEIDHFEAFTNQVMSLVTVEDINKPEHVSDIQPPVYTSLSIMEPSTIAQEADSLLMDPENASTVEDIDLVVKEVVENDLLLKIQDAVIQKKAPIKKVKRKKVVKKQSDSQIQSSKIQESIPEKKVAEKKVPRKKVNKKKCDSQIQSLQKENEVVLEVPVQEIEIAMETIISSDNNGNLNDGSFNTQSNIIEPKCTPNVELAVPILFGSDSDDDLPILNFPLKEVENRNIPSETTKKIDALASFRCPMFHCNMPPAMNGIRRKFASNVSVQYALTGRSTCRICRQNINVGELRFSILARQRHIPQHIDTWHHARCFWGVYKMRDIRYVENIEDLDQQDQDLIALCVGQMK